MSERRSREASPPNGKPCAFPKPYQKNLRFPYINVLAPRNIQILVLIFRISPYMATAPVRDFSINVGMPKKRPLPVQVRICRMIST